MRAHDHLSELENIVGQEKFTNYSSDYITTTKDLYKKRLRNENDKIILTNQVFEGVLVAAGWDNRDNVNQSSLYTQDDEDILLEHRLGIGKFKPYMNQKVRVSGDIISCSKDGRRVLVKKICRITGYSKPVIELRDEFDNLVRPVAA